jgi:hypothetical protein
MKMLIILCLFVSINLFGQNQMGNLQVKHYTFCHQDLSKLEKIEAYPNFPVDDLCSIKSCFRSISYKEINEAIYQRLIEIASKNFNDGVLLYLIDGTKSTNRANKENINLNDDNGFIYISIDDFINATEIIIAKEIYNNETERLIKRKM